MKKKYVIFILTGLFLVIGIYFGYKNYYYFKYVPDANKTKDKYYDSLKINDTITVKTQTIENNDYFSFNGVNIRNDFKNYQLSDLFVNDEYESSFVSKDNNKTFISIGKDRFNIINTFLNSKDTWVKDILKENNIKNDLDLLKYIINNKNNKPNIFSSKHEIEFYNLIYNTSLLLYPIPEKITLINGDLPGYILKDDDVVNVYLFNDIEKYVLAFRNLDYFTDDYIKELLNTIIIGEINISNNSKEECLESQLGGLITSNITPDEVNINKIINVNTSKIEYSKVKISGTGAIYVIVKTDDNSIIKTLNNYFDKKYNGYQSTKIDNNYYTYVYNGFDDFNLDEMLKVCQ